MSDESKKLMIETLKKAAEMSQKRALRKKGALDPMYRRKLNLSRDYSGFPRYPRTDVQKADRILYEHKKREDFRDFQTDLKKRLKRAEKLAEIKKAKGAGYDPKYWETPWDKEMERGRIPELKDRRIRDKMEDTIGDQLDTKPNWVKKLLKKYGKTAGKVVVIGGTAATGAGAIMRTLDALTDVEELGDESEERKAHEEPWTEEAKALRQQMMKRRLQRMK
jgi:hypothetical protein